MPHRVLILTTSTSRAGEDGPETGFDWVSLALPYWRLREAGVEIAFASVRGGKPPGDPATATLEADAGAQSGPVNMFLGDERAVLGLSQTLSAADAAGEAWDAVLLTDGRGALWDFAEAEAVAALVSAVWAGGGVLAAIGAGTAALLGARTPEDRPVVAGLRLTCPPASPDDTPPPPFDLAQRLRDRGAEVAFAAPGEPPIVIEEGRLITGQDARTAAEVSLQLLDALDVFASKGAARSPEGLPERPTG